MNSSASQFPHYLLAACLSFLDVGAYADAAATLCTIADSLLQTGAIQQFFSLWQRLPPAQQASCPLLLIAAGDAWRLQNQWQQATNYYRLAQQQAIANNDIVAQGSALSRQALLCWLRGDVDGANTLYEQATQILQPIAADHTVWNELRNGYALVLSSLARLDEAEALLTCQLRIFQRLGDVARQRQTLHNLGMMVYLRRGDFLTAEPTLREALQLAETYQQRFGIAYLSNSLAYTLNCQGNASEALSLAAQAHAIGEELAVPNVVAFACLNRAMALRQQGERQAAEEACAQGLALLQSGLSSPLRCDLLLMQARLQQGSCMAEASRIAHAALSTARLQGDKWTLALCLLQVAELNLELARFDAAQSALQEARCILTRYGDTFHMLRLNLLLARCAHHSGNWPQLHTYIWQILANIHQYQILIDTALPHLAIWLAAVLRHNSDDNATLAKLLLLWGQSAQPLLATLLRDPHERVRTWALTALSAVAQPWAWSMLAFHQDSDPTLQHATRKLLVQTLDAPLPSLELYCLGQFLVKWEQTPIPADAWTSLHAQLILVYLVLRGAVPRDELITLLWPDEDIEKTSVRLRATLRLLRKALCPPWRPDADYVIYQNECYQINPAVSLRSDVQTFQHWIAIARQQQSPARVQACTYALDCYGGLFLPGRYHEWVINEREQLDADWMWAREQYTQSLLDRGQLEAAELQARQLVHLDPLHEPHWRLLLCALQRQNRSTEAARVYHDLHTLLDKELGVAPSSETQRLLRLH